MFDICYDKIKQTLNFYTFGKELFLGEGGSKDTFYSLKDLYAFKTFDFMKGFQIFKSFNFLQFL